MLDDGTTLMCCDVEELGLTAFGCLVSDIPVLLRTTTSACPPQIASPEGIRALTVAQSTTLHERT